MRAKHTTIKDLAKILNLSVSTISRAFNDKYDIKKETRDLILKAAAEHDYKPNPFARKLINRRSFSIGVVIPEFTTTFFPQVIQGIQSVLLENNYQVLIMETGESHLRELEVIKTLEDNMVDGIILSLAKESKNIEYINSIINNGLPVVLFNRVNDDIMAPKVIFDDYRLSFFACERLIEAGYKDIVYFAAPLTLSLSRKRTKGFEDALRKHHLYKDCNQVIETGFNIEDGERITEKLLNDGFKFDAIFSSNDRSAIGAIKVLKKHGYRIPEEIGVMGFSESSLATVIEPNLSSVKQPTKKMGIEAAKLLLTLIEEDTNTGLHDVILSGDINLRASTMRESLLSPTLPE